MSEDVSNTEPSVEGEASQAISRPVMPSTEAVQRWLNAFTFLMSDECNATSMDFWIRQAQQALDGSDTWTTNTAFATLDPVDDNSPNAAASSSASPAAASPRASPAAASSSATVRCGLRGNVGVQCELMHNKQWTSIPIDAMSSFELSKLACKITDMSILAGKHERLQEQRFKDRFRPRGEQLQLPDGEPPRKKHAVDSAQDADASESPRDSSGGVFARDADAIQYAGASQSAGVADASQSAGASQSVGALWIVSPQRTAWSRGPTIWQDKVWDEEHGWMPK